MLIDFQRTQAPQIVDCDLCIVGSGPAAIALAGEFIGSDLQVYLIDDSSPATHGKDPEQVLSMQLNQWPSAPPDSVDLLPRPWLAHANWPFGNEQLQPFQRRARNFCFQGNDSPKYKVDDEPAFNSTHVHLCRQQSLRATADPAASRRALENAANVSVLLNAHALRIDVDDQGKRAVGLQIATATHRQGRIRARHYVLAGDAIDNPRLLLASNRQTGAGLGNAHDQVGRYLTMHLRAVPASVYLRLEAFGNGSEGGTADPTIAFCSTATLQGARQALATISMAQPLDGHESLFCRGLEPLPPAPEGYRRFALTSRSEQAPDPANRIQLSDEKDALGRQLPKTQWRTQEQDRQTLLAHVEALGMELARLRLGRLKIADWLLDGHIEDRMHSDSMATGTTRIGDDPRSSVADSQCRVHDIANLHLAGPSVLPTSGANDPTLTVVALALRLADGLKQKLG